MVNEIEIPDVDVDDETEDERAHEGRHTNEELASMPEPVFAIAIPHTPWKPERVASLERLKAQLFGPGVSIVDLAADKLRGIRMFEEREPNYMWSERVWRWGAEDVAPEVTHLLLLQDDVIVAPDFWPVVRTMLTVRPNDIVCLHATHPGARELFFHTPLRWYSTVDGFVGPATVIPKTVLPQLLDWRDFAMKRRMYERVNEDDLVGLFAMATGRKILSPAIAPVDHDIALESNYQNDAHPLRRPAVTFTDAEPGDWHTREYWNTQVAHFGRFYKNLCEHLPRVMRDEDFARVRLGEMRDENCPARFARFFSPV